MPENSPKNSLPWTEEHTAFCYQHHITPGGKSLWQWLMMQGLIAEEIEPDLSEFNATVAKARGKGYSHNYLKKIFDELVQHRVIQVVKQYSWKIFKLLVRPLAWLKPPRKKREKNLQNHNLSYTLDPSNPQLPEAGFVQQQQSNHDINKELLEGKGIFYNNDVTEVLDAPNNDIQLALSVFDFRGGFEKNRNPEGFIRDCLRGRWWEEPRNANRLTHVADNKLILEEKGIYYNDNVTEVLTRPSNEIKLALLILEFHGGTDTCTNPEGFIRDCLRERWWEIPRNYKRLQEKLGNTTEWIELFPNPVYVWANSWRAGRHASLKDIDEPHNNLLVD